MANITISDLPFATLPLDTLNTFFELQTIEAGVTVSRRLSAQDLGIGGGVTSVVGGTNITVDATDPLNPIVNLDAALLAVSVNGVTLTAAGSATNFLNEQGNYVGVPTGGQVNSVVGGTNITVNAADPVNPIVNLDAAITGVSVNGVTLTTGGVATNYLDETGNYSVPAGGGGAPGGANQDIQFNDSGSFGGTSEFTWDGATVQIAVDGAEIILDDVNGFDEPRLRLTSTGGGAGGSRIVLDVTTGRMALQQTATGGTAEDLWVNCLRNGSVQLYHNGTRQMETTADGVRLAVGGLSLYVDEKAAANADIAGVGQFWVRNDSPNTPMFTDDTGVDHVLNAGGGATTLFNPNPEIVLNSITPVTVTGLTQTLANNTEYYVRLVAWVTQANVVVSTSPGCRVRMNYTGTLTGEGRVRTFDNSGLLESVDGPPDQTIVGLSASGVAQNAVQLIYECTFVTTSAGDLEVQFAQNVADAVNISVMNARSYLEIAVLS